MIVLGGQICIISASTPINHAKSHAVDKKHSYFLPTKTEIFIAACCLNQWICLNLRAKRALVCNKSCCEGRLLLRDSHVKVVIFVEFLSRRSDIHFRPMLISAEVFVCIITNLFAASSRLMVRITFE